MNEKYQEIDPNDLENVAGGAFAGASLQKNPMGGSNKGARFRMFANMTLPELNAIRPTDPDYAFLQQWLAQHPENPLAKSMNGGVES